MSDYNNGQIWGWNGGECPVHSETKVQVWFRAGGTSESTGKTYDWYRDGSDVDIIAFRVVKQYVEPKVIWVNEYRTTKSGWDSEAGAKKYAIDATRVAVKYVEARDD